MPKLHRVVLYVMDFENIKPEEVKELLINSKYLNVNIQEMYTREIEDWSDDHELNKTNAPYHKYFEELI